MPVQIGAPTISGGTGTQVAESLARWSAEKRHLRAQENMRLAREAGEQTEILQGEDGKKIMPEQAKPKFGFFGSKTAEQYNKGVRDAYVLSVDNDNNTEVNRIAQEADGNLDNYEKVVSEYRNSVLGNVDPVAVNDIKQSLDQMILRGRNQVQRLGVDRQIKQDKQARQLATQNYFDESSRLTRNGEFEGAQENLLKARASLDSMVESGDMSRELADETFMDGKKEVFRQGNKKEILDIAEEDVNLAEQNLNKLEKDIPKDFTPDEWESVIDNIRADVNRIRTRVAGRASGSLKKARADLKDYKESVSLGFKIDDKERAALAKAVSGTDLQEEFARINKIEQFSVFPAEKRDAIVRKAASSPTLQGQQDYIALKKANDQLKKMAREDGYSLAVRQGLADPSPVELGNKESIAKRIQEVEQLESIYGVPVPFFQETEAQALVDGLETASIEEKVSLAQNLGGVPNAWEQIADKNAGVFAMSGAIGDPAIMRAVFTGQELLKTKQVKQPGLQDMESILEKKIGLPGEIYGPEDRNNIIQSAIAHYAATTSNVADFDSDSFKKSLDAVTGGTGEINGGKVELPRGITEDQLEDFITEIEPETLELFGGTDQPVEVIRNAVFVSLGNGVYRAMAKVNEFGGMPYLNKEGKPLDIQYTERALETNEGVRKAKEMKAEEAAKKKRKRQMEFFRSGVQAVEVK